MPGKLRSWNCEHVTSQVAWYNTNFDHKYNWITICNTRNATFFKIMVCTNGVTCVTCYILHGYAIIFAIMFSISVIKSIWLLCSLYYQLRKAFWVWGEVNLVRLSNLLVKFKCFSSEWRHFIFNWIKGFIFPYMSNITFAGNYYRGVFINTYVVWIMILGWW